MDGQVVALDVGGTRIKTALIGYDGDPYDVETVPTDRGRGPDAVVARVLDIAARRCADQARAGRPPLAAGLTLPGIVDETTGVAGFSANVGWRDVPIGDLLSRRLGVPAALCHDVRAAGLAEARLGAGRDVAEFAFVAIGTGIGGALITHGRPRTGAHHRAGEIGHVVIAPDGPPCGCGARGCVETYASASAIEQRYARRTGSMGADAIAVGSARGDAAGKGGTTGTDAGRADAVGTGVAAAGAAEGSAGRVDAAGVAALVAEGDPVAAEIWADAVRALARGLMTWVTLADPGLVVLGGGLAEAGATLLDPLATALAERSYFQVPPRLELTRLGELAGCQGAGLAAWDLITGGRGGTGAGASGPAALA